MFRGKSASFAFRSSRRLTKQHMGSTKYQPPEIRVHVHHGIGLSGPCDTPDFVPASIFFQETSVCVSDPQDVLDGQQDMGNESSESVISDRQPLIMHENETFTCKKAMPLTLELVDVDVIIQRTHGGLDIELAGGLEEGTQVEVHRVVPGSFTERSESLLAGDLVLAVNGVSVVGSRRETVLRLMEDLCTDAYGRLIIPTDLRLSIRGYREVTEAAIWSSKKAAASNATLDSNDTVRHFFPHSPQGKKINKVQKNDWTARSE